MCLHNRPVPWFLSISVPVLLICRAEWSSLELCSVQPSQLIMAAPGHVFLLTLALWLFPGQLPRPSGCQFSFDSLGGVLLPSLA